MTESSLLCGCFSVRFFTAAWMVEKESCDMLYGLESLCSQINIITCSYCPTSVYLLRLLCVADGYF